MSKPLNVLWIQSDELRADALGCYGGVAGWPAPRTPNLDALAARGVLFSETYCNSPICVPSRTSMLSGCYPHETGIYNNEALHYKQTLPEDLITFPQAFRAAGYDTISFGKRHTPNHPIWGQPNPEIKRTGGNERDQFAKDFAARDLIRTPGPPHVVISGILDLKDGERTFGQDLTDTSLDWLESRRNNPTPWLLRVSHGMPHTPVLALPRLAELFDPADFAYDPQRDTRHEGMTPFERFVSEAQLGEKLKPEEIEKARSHYWAVVSHLDEEVGRLLEKLKDLGVERETIIVFDCDHGTMLGEMGLWQKQIYHRTVHRVPQIFSCPGLLPEGQVRDDLNSLIDRSATLCGLCGVPRPHNAGGRNLFGDEPEPEAVYSIIGYGQPNSLLYPLVGVGPMTPRRACVRTRDFRYEESVRAMGEDIPSSDSRRMPTLVDCRNDPQERMNVSDLPQYAQVTAHLSSLLEEWLKGDCGYVPPASDEQSKHPGVLDSLK